MINLQRSEFFTTEYCKHVQSHSGVVGRREQSGEFNPINFAQMRLGKIRVRSILLCATKPSSPKDVQMVPVVHFLQGYTITANKEAPELLPRTCTTSDSETRRYAGKDKSPTVKYAARMDFNQKWVIAMEIGKFTMLTKVLSFDWLKRLRIYFRHYVPIILRCVQRSKSLGRNSLK